MLLQAVNFTGYRLIRRTLITMQVPTLCDWFGASASDSDNLVFTRSEEERKRWNRKLNRNAVFTRS